MNKYQSLIFIAVFLLVVGFSTYLRFEPSEEDGNRLVGEIVLYVGGSNGKAPSYSYFVVKLENGEQVKVRDLGDHLPNFKGQVPLIATKGKTSGRTIYTFAK